MAGKKTRPVIGKLIVSSGHRSAEVGTSPKTPLELRIVSPRGIISSDVSGVGLGIVAALEKSGDCVTANFCCRSPIRSDPIPVNPAPARKGDVCVDHDTDTDTDSFEEEEYTIVTCRKPNKSYTRIYHGGCVYDGIDKACCLFEISQAKSGSEMELGPDFDLTSCGLCSKKLHGKDIYMYRGEKAFCSRECRYREIGMDETRREKYCSKSTSSSSSSSSTSSAVGVPTSTSPCPNAHMFLTGIFAI